jgi:hypothetical protein
MRPGANEVPNLRWIAGCFSQTVFDPPHLNKYPTAEEMQSANERGQVMFSSSSSDLATTA